MPRILDAIDAAVGRTPEALHGDEVDYLHMKPGPDSLIGDDGRYQAGWFARFDGDINFSETSALRRSLQVWHHLAFDLPDQFVVVNLADLAKAGQTAILIADKKSGAIRHAAVTRLFARNQVRASDGFHTLTDLATGSFVTTDADHDRWRFSIHAEDVHLIGTARRVGGPAFTQVTRFHRMRGSLQRYGNLMVERAMLSVGDTVHTVPPGTLGTFDHTIGHQRGLQNWNWIACVGRAYCEESGAATVLGLQVARDRALARPRVDSHKTVVWVDHQLHKIPSAGFAYDYTDEQAKETGPWTVRSAPEDLDGDRWLDLSFEPRFHRRERKSVVLVDADFNQYYGAVSGRVRIGDRTWRVPETFAVTEESQLEL